MRYYVSNAAGGTPQVTGTTYKTAWSLTAASGPTTLRRAYIYAAEFGTDGAPVDNVMIWGMRRQTTVGTGSAVTTTIGKLDDTDAPQLITVTVNHTVEPTPGNILMDAAVNQRTTFRWLAVPGVGELIVPAINLNGIGGIFKSANYQGTVLAGVYWQE